MKLLLPIDYSDYSNYAIDLAKKFNDRNSCELTLCHMIDAWNDIAELSIPDDQKENILSSVEQAEHGKLVQAAQALESDFKMVDYQLLKDKYVEGLQALLDKDNYDLLIVGSQGKHSRPDWQVGSRTSQVLKKIKKNVLIVKQSPANLDIKEVVFVTGLDKEDQKAFKEFLRIIKHFAVKEVHVLTVDTFSYFSQPSILMKEALNDFKQLASDFEVDTHFYSDYSINAGVRHFKEEFKIDLIGISNHFNHPLKRLFTGSTVETIINKVDVPILSIDYS
jgi:nucleotide-binding universal stress UspA family protein